MNPSPPDTPIPLVAILRGVLPEHVLDVAEVISDAGIRMIEVPLNSPDAFASIAALASRGREDWVIGAGTVLTIEDVRRTRESGGSLIVAPNCNPRVIAYAVESHLQVMPGIATATEAFAAVDAGARQLKLFPAKTYGPGHLKALRAVLPAQVGVLAVGGVGAADIPGWLEAGAGGFGFGSELFRPDYSLPEIARRAKLLVDALPAASRIL
jgi:2-dehydro-3-deoxyphosphogalactonate aldolase